MLSAAKHLLALHYSPFAEFTLSVANVLRVTLDGSSRKPPHLEREAINPGLYNNRAILLEAAS
jgi:hypothetical protein